MLLVDSALEKQHLQTLQEIIRRFFFTYLQCVTLYRFFFFDT